MKISHLALTLLLVACSFGGPKATAIIAPTQSTATPSPEPPLLILLAPSGSDAGVSAATAEIAGAYASAHGMRFEQRDVLNPSQLPAGLAKLLILAPEPGAFELAMAAPAVSVITIGFSAPDSRANLTSLPLNADGSDAVAFIAGYSAAIIAEDWRVGMLYTPASAATVNDFVAGAEYFCGSCAPEAPPYIEYPQAAEAVDTLNRQDWQGAADQLLAQSVRVVYLSPEFEGSGAAEYLGSYGVLLVGSGAPAADLAAGWLLSISEDPLAGLRQQLPLALDGQPLGQVSSVVLSNGNPSLLSAARLANIQNVIDDLLAGYIGLPEDD